MKPIRITQANEQAIATVLMVANGRAKTHTITSYLEVEHEALGAERRLEALGVPKAERGGARFSVWRATYLPNAYKNMAIGTGIRLLRRSGGWWLVDAEAYSFGSRTRTRRHLSLTPAQDAKAVAVLRAGYSILPTPNAFVDPIGEPGQGEDARFQQAVNAANAVWDAGFAGERA